MPIWFFGASLIALLVCLARPFRVANTTFYVRLLCPTALRLLGIKLVVRHQERLHSDRPRILLANHQHIFDAFVFGSFFPEQTVTIGKKSLRFIPIFGWVYWL